MKTLLLALLSFVTIGLSGARAEDFSSLPFPVSIGGQAATLAKGEPFAKLAKPVKNDAAIEVTAKTDQIIIINVHKTDAKGAPDGTASPAIILLQNTNKGSLSGTMDKRTLAPGDYLISVVAGTKTSSVLIKVE